MDIFENKETKQEMSQLRTRFDELLGWTAESVVGGWQIYDQERFGSPVGFYNSDNHTLQMCNKTSDRLTSTEPGRELQSSKPVPCNGLLQAMRQEIGQAYLKTRLPNKKPNVKSSRNTNSRPTPAAVLPNNNTTIT